MSKGSKPRPFSVSNEEYANRWDAIFGRDLKESNELRRHRDESEVKDDKKDDKNDVS